MVVTDTSGSRVEAAYDWLLAEITGFRLRTGAALSENRIATELGISRTPVREALQRLEKEGLVKRGDNARFTVSQITTREVEEACDLLEALDTYIFRKAASKLTEEDARVLLATVDRMAEAAASGDRGAWSEADLTFHRTANSIADNRLVAETVKETRRRIQRFWLRAAMRQDRLASCSTEHRIMAEAMVAKDYGAIDTAVTQHIDHMRQGVLDLLASVAAVLGDD